MILSTLPLRLKGSINTRVAEATQHQRTAPTLKQLWDILEHSFHESDPLRTLNGGGPSSPGWSNGKCAS